MKKFLALLCFMLLLTIFMPSVTYAVDDGTNTTVTVPFLTKLEITSGPLHWTGVGDHPDPPSIGDYMADVSSYSPTLQAEGWGWTQISHTLYVRVYANAEFSLLIQGTSEYWNHDGNISSKLPTDLLWQDGGSSWTPVQYNNPVSIYPDPIEPKETGKLVPLFFVVLLHWNQDTEGTWTYQNVLFTVDQCL